LSAVFSLSSKAVYGVAALLELAASYRAGPLQIRDIAERNKIPQHYLEQILAGLKKSGLLRSYRGAQGGYELAKHPDTVRLIDILAELEGPLKITPGGEVAESLAFLWDDLEDHIATYLTRSLGQILREKRARRGDQDFII
jgi:Rrf2 family transcriptional regulator, cysteine metabolism repressor